MVQKQRHMEAMELERSQAKDWEQRLENATNENAVLREQAEHTAATEAAAHKRAEEAKRLAGLNERLLQEAMNTLSVKMQKLARPQESAEERLAPLAARGETIVKKPKPFPNWRSREQNCGRRGF